MKYFVESEADCMIVMQKRACAQCIHHDFCERRKRDISAEFKKRPAKKESISKWDQEDHGKGKKGKFGVE
jgi:hypothetical protein